jgi:hypothetical protein
MVTSGSGEPPFVEPEAEAEAVAEVVVDDVGVAPRLPAQQHSPE